MKLHVTLTFGLENGLWSFSMVIHVAWYNQQQRILLLTFPASWDWEDFGVAYREALAMACHTGQPVDVMIDMRYTRRLPPHALNHAIRLASRWKDAFDRVVFVTDEATLYPFGYAARNIIPRARRQGYHTTTLTEAADLLKKPIDRVARVR
jgi:hypothetical protein